jgi:hypothetical protein
MEEVVPRCGAKSLVKIAVHESLTQRKKRNKEEKIRA